MTAHRDRIAIVGMACHYPDAASPAELWENVLSQRRAFRPLPDERMRSADYYSGDRSAPDRFYCRNAAVIEGYEFDRVGFHVPGRTYRSTDLTHWLALDVASRALADAGFPEGAGLPAETTCVVVGNTLTGEFARANLMRLRWPYVRRTVGATLREQGWTGPRLEEFLNRLEQQYKEPFPPIDEDTLAGGLSNTIAGRICNHYDLRAGGYTVDGACSSSLLSVVTACRGLVSGDFDVALAGGVDLSIDPFEIVGFAKTGAVTATDMRVYDRESSGFWPGEGCGMVVLMREEDAAARGLRPYGLLAGWGVSSDGRGGITRPMIDGYRLAMRRAYAIAGFGPDTVELFEGHSTGTKVGDDVELGALSLERGAGGTAPSPAAVGSIKALIGHTKAACGVAGLIKAAMAVRSRIIPPTAGCLDPHEALTGERPMLRVTDTGEPWPEDRPVRAGVTSMGFGGINTHVVLEAAHSARAPEPMPERASILVRSAQDSELLLFGGADLAELRERAAKVAAIAARLSFAELGDLAAVLHGEAGGRWRAAVAVSSPESAAAGLALLLSEIDSGGSRVLNPRQGVFLGETGRAGRIGFLFPGQGSDRGGAGGAVRRRFPELVGELYRDPARCSADHVDTAHAQPRIVTSSLAGLRLLAALGIEARVALGHSLGELTALHWAGSYDEETLLRVATVRGRAMSELGQSGGAMAGVAASADQVLPLLTGEPVVIAGYNGPAQTVVSGPGDAVRRVGTRARRQGLAFTPLPVSHAFHSPLVEPAAETLAEHLSGEWLTAPAKTVLSTVTGAPLDGGTDIVDLLRDQVSLPVRFTEAVRLAAAETDLLLEVGPGHTLSGLAEAAADVPAIALDVDSPSLSGLHRAVGAAIALGVPVRTGMLFDGRFTKPFDPDRPLRFFANPCEAAPEFGSTGDAGPIEAGPADAAAIPAPEAAGDPGEIAEEAAETPSSVDVLRQLIADRTELPLEAVRADGRPLDDLHLSSITVGQIVSEAARELGRTSVAPPSSFATATVAELATALDELALSPAADGDREVVAGVSQWVRPFAVSMETTAPVARPPAGNGERAEWQLFAPDGHEFAEPLREALETAGLGKGVLVCLPAGQEDDGLDLLLAAAKAALAEPADSRFVLVQCGWGAAAFAKTLVLEDPRILTTVVDLPPGPDAVELTVAEVAATRRFAEVRYAGGVRQVPVLKRLDAPSATELPLGPDSVLLVTGGGRGITAECAFALAADSGASLALLGRADPAQDAELAANLERLDAAGVRYRYVRADVTVPEQVAAAVAEFGTALGDVTAVLHGAGRNVPRPLSALDEEAFRATVRPKVDGLRAVLAAVDPARLTLLVTFGSVIGRAGLAGQADYATANEWMSALTVRFGQENPGCTCLAIEWSVWSGVGMGEKLGAVDSLLRQGITPISTDTGVAVLRRLAADPASPAVTVVSGRLDGMPTVQLEHEELPLWRFTDRALVHYPGIEVVTEAELSSAADPYLDDHLLDGSLLFPAVLGLEAMTQAAMAAAGAPDVCTWENVEFLRPVTVPPDGATTIRIAALVRDSSTVDTVVRSSETGFLTDHFRATCRLAVPPPGPGPAHPGAGRGAEAPPAVPIDPDSQLYGSLFFQGKRFQRVRGYRALAARGCVAELAVQDRKDWFGMFLPEDLVLGDPGVRDALMHAVQCCVPDATLLPVGIERLWHTRPRIGQDTLSLYAKERSRDGDTYLYDVELHDSEGRVVERWDGLQLRAVRKQDGTGPWLPPLVGPYLERRLPEVLGCAPMAVSVEPEGAGERAEAGARAAGRALGRAVRVRHRPDGKPEIPGVSGVSLAHGAGVALAVLGDGPLGCDVEPVAERSAADWAGLLGPDRHRLAELVARETGEPESLAATRVWSALECLVKAGRAVDEPLVLDAGAPPGWVLFAAGPLRVATFRTVLADPARPVVFAAAANRAAISDTAGPGARR
ncbi:SDR family NAD(P)-dependent oxidoreductase [Amycolatopsis sp. NPDC059090]|uniref:SDR family NAD(P)-dependent oxidoreductase n=1 Tax=unclassified Amycolatopsis TaxID=2618356 RepID=UPI00366FD2A1